MAKNYEVGDKIILIDDEDPDTYRARVNKKPRKNIPNRRQKMAFIDEIDEVKNGKAKTKKFKFKTNDLNTNFEDSSESAARFNRGEPERKVYYADLDLWFPVPNGMIVEFEEVEIDEVFLEQVIIPFDRSVRES